MRKGRALVFGLGIAAASAFFVWKRDRPQPVKTPPEVAPAAAAPEPVIVSPPPAAPGDAAAPVAEPAPKRSPSAKPAARPPGDPFVDALMATTPEGARLNADYARARLPAPAEARTLIDMRRRGVPQEQLVAYVRTSFPKGILVRAIALRWLGVGAANGKVVQAGTDPGSTLAPRAVP
jgi:hypothetical protein